MLKGGISGGIIIANFLTMTFFKVWQRSGKTAAWLASQARDNLVKNIPEPVWKKIGLSKENRQKNIVRPVVYRRAVR